MSEDFLTTYEEAEIDVQGIGQLGIEFFRINEQDLSGEIEKQAAYYAFWTTAEADAHRDYANAKLDVKVLSAQKRKYYKSLDPKVTLPILAAEVDSDMEVVAAERSLIEVEHKMKMIKAITMALQQKKDMLSSKTGLMRTEMEVNLKEMGIKALGGGK